MIWTMVPIYIAHMDRGNGMPDVILGPLRWPAQSWGGSYGYWRSRT